MEKWYELVRNLSDEQENQKQFKELTTTVFRLLTTRRIKDMRKFEQRLGPEYEQFVEDLKFPEGMVQDLLKNDEFFELSLKLQSKYKR
jgi:hypothetical protein